MRSTVSLDFRESKINRGTYNFFMRKNKILRGDTREQPWFEKDGKKAVYLINCSFFERMILL